MTSSAPKDLLQGARAGDLACFERLVHAHQWGVRIFLAARMTDLHEAEDLAQEVFLVAYRRIREFDPGRSFSAWLRGIAANLLRNHLRRRRPHSGSEAFLEQEAVRYAEELESRSEASRILEALRKCVGMLDARSRRLVELRYHEGESVSAIARSAKAKHSAITMAFHRIRKRLQSCVESRLAISGGGRE